MTPAQFLARMKKREIAPAYLFVGPEFYQRRICREALLRAALGDADRDSAVTRYDLTQATLTEVIDNARALSLFASDRVILVTGAEGVLPKGKAAVEDPEEDGGTGGSGHAELVARYLKDPSPGVVLLFDCDRFDFDGEDKARIDRVRKFYAAIPDAVELRRYAVEDAVAEAEKLARRAGLAVIPPMQDGSKRPVGRWKQYQTERPTEAEVRAW